MTDTNDTSDTLDTSDTSNVSLVSPAINTFDTFDTTSIDIDDATFHADVAYLESLWRRVPIGAIDLPIIDIGAGAPIVFVPILEHFEFVYARQMRALSQSRRVILYRRREDRQRFVGLAERAEELRSVLDALGLQQVDLAGHGDAAMVLLEFAARYPQLCRSLVIIAQAADYQIAPHPFIWLLHELYMRLPVEHIVPARLLRRIVINYIVASHPTPNAPERIVRRGGGGGRVGWGRLRRPRTPLAMRFRQSSDTRATQASPPPGHTTPAPTDRQNSPVSNRPVQRLPRHLIEEQFEKIALWPSLYKFSVLPIIHTFDMRSRLGALTTPVLLLNRADDVLAPEVKTRWLAEHLPNCAGYYLVPGRERFFIYAQAEEVNRLLARFYETN
jgi:pimeloyl-ACP methyl ester carboxylesterase